jgi:hypothetical protein
MMNILLFLITVKPITNILLLLSTRPNKMKKKLNKNI